MSMRNAIECGATKALKQLLDGQIENGNFASVVADHILAENLLGDDVLEMLTPQFHNKVQKNLRELAKCIDYAANHKPLSVMPNAISEWYELLEKINRAVFEHVHHKDVLEALRFINMTGCEWSDYTHPQEAEDGD